MRCVIFPSVEIQSGIGLKLSCHMILKLLSVMFVHRNIKLKKALKSLKMRCVLNVRYSYILHRIGVTGSPDLKANDKNMIYFLIQIFTLM